MLVQRSWREEEDGAFTMMASSEFESATPPNAKISPDSPSASAATAEDLDTRTAAERQSRQRLHPWLSMAVALFCVRPGGP